MPDEKSNSPISSSNIKAHNVTIKNIEKGKTAYISIHSFISFNIDSDMQIIKPYLRSIKDYKALIIDIRGNGGGDSTYWSDNIVPMLINKSMDDTQYIAYRGGDFVEQFIKNRMKYGYEKMNPISDIYKENLKNLPPELKDTFKYYWKNVNRYEPKSSIGFKGKIYLLVDGCVFSSSEAFAAFAKSTGFAVLVGEKTGGDGLGDGPAVCALPNSGYVFEFTKEMGLVSDGACNFEHKTEPDIKVSAKYGSNISNDEAIQTVLKLVN
jgi:C-terminal processing protease CtpA/Prc